MQVDGMNVQHVHAPQEQVPRFWVIKYVGRSPNGLWYRAVKEEDIIHNQDGSTSCLFNNQSYQCECAKPVPYMSFASTEAQRLNRLIEQTFVGDVGRPMPVDATDDNDEGFRCSTCASSHKSAFARQQHYKTKKHIRLQKQQVGMVARLSSEPTLAADGPLTSCQPQRRNDQLTREDHQVARMFPNVSAGPHAATAGSSIRPQLAIIDHDKGTRQGGGSPGTSKFETSGESSLLVATFKTTNQTIYLSSDGNSEEEGEKIDEEEEANDISQLEDAWFVVKLKGDDGNSFYKAKPKDDFLPDDTKVYHNRKYVHGEVMIVADSEYRAKKLAKEFNLERN